MTIPRWRGSSPSFAMLSALMNDHLDPGYAEAARKRLVTQPPSPVTTRTLSLLTVLALAVTGVVLATAYRQADVGAPDAAHAKKLLVRDVTGKSNATDALQAEAERLRQQVTAERESALAGSASGQQTADQLRDLEAGMGLRPVRGPGLTVTVGDGPPPTDPVTGEVTAESDAARVVDRDLQELVNALWRAGAEAVAVNGRRLTPTSTIRLAGEAILVDLRPVSNPYRIEAVGDPSTLDGRFTGSDLAKAFRSYVTRYEMVFQVSSAGRLTLPAAPAAVVRYAREQTPGTQDGPSPRGPALTPTPTGGNR